MARYAIQDTTRDNNGTIIPSATVTVTDADTSTASTIYAAKSGGSAISGGAVTSDSNGRFIFYVDDGDYVSGDQFDLAVSKTGYVAQSYSDKTAF